MSICVIGINHKTASTAIRERFTIAEKDYSSHIELFCQHPNINAACIISTCNRTEFYLALEDQDNWEDTVNEVLDFDTERQYFYHSLNVDCAAHLFSVTAGIDSLVLGETQIQGQVKRAYEASLEVVFNSELSQLFQMAFKTAKAVRSDTEIGKNPVSVAHCAVQLSRQIFGQLCDQKVLIIGAGKTSELILRYLVNHGANYIAITNRTYSKAEKLAQVFDKESFQLSELSYQIADFDLVFAATASPTVLIDLRMIQEAIRRRKHRPMVIIDLSVPRNVGGAIKDLDDVFLYAIDDLQQVITENMQKRQSTVDAAMRIIKAEAELFSQWQKRQRHHGLLKQLQNRFQADKDVLLNRQVPKDLNDQQREKINVLVHQLTQKLSHQSITAFRKVIELGNDEYIKFMAEVFDLEWNDDK